MQFRKELQKPRSCPRGAVKAMKLPRRTCQGAAKKEPHRPRSCPGGTVKESQGVAQDELPRPPPGAGSCRCPSATGAPLCSTRTQVRTCHCHMEGRPRPSNLSPWSSWCTCHKWKAWMLAEAGVRDPSCKCPAGAGSAPSAYSQEYHGSPANSRRPPCRRRMSRCWGRTPR